MNAGTEQQQTQVAGQPISRFTWPTAVVLGNGALDSVGAEAARLGSRVLVITDSGVRGAGLVAPLEAALEGAGLQAAVWDGVASDPSVENVEAARSAIAEHDAEVVVAVGGGSSIDAAKAAAALATSGGGIRDYEGFDLIDQPTLPLIAVPTTVGTGSEVTKGAVISDKVRELKMVIVSDHLYPRLALLDPESVRGLPGPIAAATGLDALAHAVEGYTTRNATPISDALTLQAIRIIGRQLRPAVAGQPDSLYEMLVASCLAGAGFHTVGLGLAHALASTIGGHYPVPHGVATGLFLPHVMRFNTPADPAKFAAIAVALGEGEPDSGDDALAPLAAEAVAQLVADVGSPARLRDVDVPAESFAAVARESLDHIDRPGNPRENDAADLEALCVEAY
jgi:alcohol dehydrogenase class IV